MPVKAEVKQSFGMPARDLLHRARLLRRGPMGLLLRPNIGRIMVA